eukprot:531347-Amphidinium_carterae.1
MANDQAQAVEVTDDETVVHTTTQRFWRVDADHFRLQHQSGPGCSQEFPPWRSWHCVPDDDLAADQLASFNTPPSNAPLQVAWPPAPPPPVAEGTRLPPRPPLPPSSSAGSGSQL